MQPEEWKDFVNALFVNIDGTRKAAQLKLTIEANGSKLPLPELTVAHTDTLQQIFVKVRQLTDNVPADAPEEQSAVPTDRIKAVHVEHIKHGNTEYIVYRMSDGGFRVVKTSGEEVQPKTIIYNTVVKKYREQYKLE